jgi:hypothetical protein
MTDWVEVRASQTTLASRRLSPFLGSPLCTHLRTKSPWPVLHPFKLSSSFKIENSIAFST